MEKGGGGREGAGPGAALEMEKGGARADWGGGGDGGGGGGLSVFLDPHAIYSSKAESVCSLRRAITRTIVLCGRTVTKHEHNKAITQ